MTREFTKNDWESAGARRRGWKTFVWNLDFAIYCHMLHLTKKINLPVLQVWRINRGKHEIVFEDPDDVVSGLEANFANSSEAAPFASAQRSLKSIMREKARERPMHHRTV